MRATRTRQTVSWGSIGLLVFSLVLAGCGAGTITLSEAFPDEGSVPGWTPVDTERVFDDETLYDLVDGQADAFFVYGFEQVIVRDYEHTDGSHLSVELWQLATPADAYGLFTTGIAGQPINVGNDGDADPGRRVVFWQDRYYVRVRARQERPPDELRAFAESVAAELPSGGERPALLAKLPGRGLEERSALFFHEEISIQNYLWLGGENVLGLGPETDGILARYDVDGATALLLLVQYPDAPVASTGLDTLQAGQVEELVVAAAKGNLLGAVFGQVDDTAAAELLSIALDNE